MTRYLFDADVWNHSRSLSAAGISLTQRIVGLPATHMPLLFTERIAFYELSDLQDSLKQLHAQNLIRIEKVSFKDANFKRLRRIVHTGEAEAMAWMLHSSAPTGVVFVTRDTRAALQAVQEKLLCTDLFGVVIELLEIGAMTEEEARELTVVWEDKAQQLGRPPDWEGYDGTISLRRARGAPYAPKWK